MTTPDHDIDREAIKAHFIAERGYWRPWTEALLRDNPRFLERYASYAGHPARVGPLSEKMVELIYVALDASSTHLYGSGLRTHMEKALAVGARPQEIFDVLHLVAAQGIDSVCQAVEILAQESAALKTDATAMAAASERAALATGEPALPAALQARIERLRLRASPAALGLLARQDPGYLPVLLDFLEQGRPDDGLSAAERCLIEVALRACFTGFDPVALRQCIRRALHGGCAVGEVLQAIQLGAHLSVHGAALGAGVFAELGGAAPADKP